MDSFSWLNVADDLHGGSHFTLHFECVAAAMKPKTYIVCSAIEGVETSAEMHHDLALGTYRAGQGRRELMPWGRC